MKLTAKAAAVPPIAMDWNRPGLRATDSGMFNGVNTKSQSLESGALDERTTSSLTYFLKKNKRSTHQVESGRTTVCCTVCILESVTGAAANHQIKSSDLFAHKRQSQ